MDKKNKGCNLERLHAKINSTLWNYYCGFMLLASMWLNVLLVRHSAKTLQLVGGSQYPGTVVTSCRLLFSWLQNQVSPWLLKLACVVFTCTNKQNKTGRLCHLISYFCENTADDTSHLIILQVTVTAAASRAAAAICAAMTSNYERASAVKMKIPPVCRSLLRL